MQQPQTIAQPLKSGYMTAFDESNEAHASALASLIRDQIVWHNSCSPESRQGTDTEESAAYLKEVMDRHALAQQFPPENRPFEIFLWIESNRIRAAATMSFSDGSVGDSDIKQHDLIERPDEMTAYLEELVVSDGSRGLGIGSKFIEKLFDRAVERGCAKLWLACYASNPSACAFYERSGMHPVRVIYEKNLGR